MKIRIVSSGINLCRLVSILLVYTEDTALILDLKAEQSDHFGEMYGTLDSNGSRETGSHLPFHSS